MLDPLSTIVSDIVGANVPEDPNATWVCGKVRGKNGLGGYAQPVPFMGMIAPLKAGGSSFIVVAIADANAASQSRVLTTCLDNLK